MDDLEAVLSRVRDRAVPEPAERDRLRTVAVELADRTREAIADLPVDADVVQVGSTARDTWVSGDRDIDLFVRFDAALDREQLERSTGSPSATPSSRTATRSTRNTPT